MKQVLPVACAALLAFACPVFAQSPPAPSYAASQAYVLSPDDQLDISVLGHPEVSQNVVVLPDGTFRFPIVGAVQAAGMTVAELTNKLTQGLSSDLNQPEVTVTVIKTRPRDCSVLGAVRGPGLIPIKTGTNLLDVLAAAGGLAQLPSLTTATLVTDAGAKSVALDVQSLMAGTDPQQNFPMKAGDILLVEAKDPSAGEVQVIGQVEKPGSYEVPVDGMTVATLLAETGGATTIGALTEAQIMHDGHALPVNLHPLMSNLNDPVGQTLVMPGDVLLVPQDNQYIGILGEVREPARYEIPDGRPITVSQAVSIAGGPTTDAMRNKSVIIRQQPDGKPLVIPVNIDNLLAGKGKSADIVLEDGDILYIPTLHRGGFNPLNLIGDVPALSYIVPKL